MAAAQMLDSFGVDKLKIFSILENKFLTIREPPSVAVVVPRRLYIVRNSLYRALSRRRGAPDTIIFTQEEVCFHKKFISSTDTGTKPFSILFVCLGNICRSPTIEAVFKEIVKRRRLESKFKIDFAGTIDYHEVMIPTSYSSVLILSIDGSGATDGILVGKSLAHLEAYLQKKSDDADARIADYFDVVAGVGNGQRVSPTFILSSKTLVSAHKALVGLGGSRRYLLTGASFVKMVRISVLNDALKSMYNAEKRGKRQVMVRPSSKVVIKFLLVMQKHGYIGEFEYVDDHRSGKIVVELNGRLNKCGVISPRFDVAVTDIENWTARLLPSRQFGYIVLTTSAGIMDHEEARRKNVGGKVLGFFY
ncbi:hypothetical protein NE237_005493 [Protea cynaroides]|uniref:Phosphotyrosine protein phosphatase I domain-containing protein n=1 Tax=Protea cynaroides TaxID=273540 RepID=A0A9Q0KKZ0_9MAGN|nr:hypothetical protein NE237_005493 [Protea cynaroides]